MTARTRAAVAYAAMFTAVGAHAPYLVVYYRQLGLDIAAIGATVSIAALVGFSAAPAWGWLSDRFDGSPRVFLLATVTAATGSILLSAALFDVPVVVGAALLAVGMAGMAPILDARALERAGAERHGFGPLRAWGSAGYIASSFLTGVGILAFGMGALFAVLTTAIVVTGVVGVTLVPHDTSESPPPRGAIRALFGRRGLGGFLGAAFVTWIALAAIMAFYPLRLTELGAPAPVVGLASALGAAVEVPLMLRFPALLKRFGAERLVVAGAAMFALRALVAGLTGDPAVLVAASAIGGVGYALFLVGGVTHVSLRAPTQLAATAQGAFQGTVSLGQVAAASLGGIVAGGLGIEGLFLVCAALAGVAVWLVAVTVGSSSRARVAEPVVADS